MRWWTPLVVVAAACSFHPGALPGGSSAGGDAGDASGPPPEVISSAWPYKRKLTINNTGLGTFDKLAVAVLLDSTRITYGATSPQGADLRFSDGGGTNLAYELERWDPAGTSIAWVRVPTIAAGTTTDLWMYYGNPIATDAQDPTAVWDSDYLGVWHMVDGHDSTLRTTSSNIGAAPTTGKIGPALSFSGGGKYIDTGNKDHLTAWTVEAWTKPATASAATGASSIVSGYPDYMILWSCNGATFCHTVMYQGSQTATHIASYSLTVGAWNHIVGRYDGTTLEAYVAGSMVGTEATTDAPLVQTYTTKIGTRMDLLGDFDGAIDEVRISRTARSPDYIQAQYRSTSDTYGPEQGELGS